MALLEGTVKASILALAYEGTAPEHAKRIMGLVIADNSIGGKAAQEMIWNEVEILGNYTSFRDTASRGIR